MCIIVEICVLSYGYLMVMLWLSFGMICCMARVWALAGLSLGAGGIEFGCRQPKCNQNEKIAQRYKK